MIKTKETLWICWKNHAGNFVLYINNRESTERINNLMKQIERYELLANQGNIQSLVDEL